MKIASTETAEHPKPRQEPKAAGWLALAATIVLWTLPTLFQYYLVQYYDTWTQNFYRYLFGFLSLLPFAIWRVARRNVVLTPRNVAACIWPALPNAVHQLSQTVAVAALLPGLYSMFGRVSVIMTALLALIFFADERRLVRDWRFQLGTLLGVMGAVGVFGFKSGAAFTLAGLPIGGVLAAFAASSSWALYGILVKRFTEPLGSTVGFTVVAAITTLLLLPLMVWKGDWSLWLRVGWRVNVILVLSSVLCIGLGHFLYYVAIKELGAAFSQSMQLVCPLAAVLLSSWIFAERLTPGQILSGGLVLAGALVTILAQGGRRPVESEED